MNSPGHRPHLPLHAHFQKYNKLPNQFPPSVFLKMGVGNTGDIWVGCRQLFKNNHTFSKDLSSFLKGTSYFNTRAWTFNSHITSSPSSATGYFMIPYWTLKVLRIKSTSAMSLFTQSTYPNASRSQYPNM